VETKVATAPTTASARVESAVASTTITEAKGATRLSKLGSGLAKVGSVGFHLLLPGPLDGIMLLAQFAGSYAEAHEAIRSRNTRSWFSIGLSANLLNRSFGAMREHLSRKLMLDRDVHTQVLGAVGMAEKAHNTGLASGFAYGERLSADARDALREIGFSALAAQGKLEGGCSRRRACGGSPRLCFHRGPDLRSHGAGAMEEARQRLRNAFSSAGKERGRMI
jgi:hypothetical protein